MKKVLKYSEQIKKFALFKLLLNILKKFSGIFKKNKRVFFSIIGLLFGAFSLMITLISLGAIPIPYSDIIFQGVLTFDNINGKNIVRFSGPVVSNHFLSVEVYGVLFIKYKNVGGFEFLKDYNQYYRNWYFSDLCEDNSKVDHDISIEFNSIIHNNNENYIDSYSELPEDFSNEDVNKGLVWFSVINDSPFIKNPRNISLKNRGIPIQIYFLTRLKYFSWLFPINICVEEQFYSYIIADIKKFYERVPERINRFDNKCYLSEYFPLNLFSVQNVFPQTCLKQPN